MARLVLLLAELVHSRSRLELVFRSSQAHQALITTTAHHPLALARSPSRAVLHQLVSPDSLVPRLLERVRSPSQVERPPRS